MNLDNIRLLLRVVEQGSMQRAAQSLGLSRSNVRRNLDNLEAEFGCEIFLRSASGVRLTPAGAVVLEEGRGLLERFERMSARVQFAKDDASGPIKVVIPVGMPDPVRIGFIRGIVANEPGLQVTEVELPEPLDHLHESFDLMIHFGSAPEQGHLFSRVIWRARLVPLASEAYLEEFGRPSSPADLAGHRLMSWNVRGLSPYEWPLLSGGTLPVAPIVCSRNGQMLHRAAQEGLGILFGNPDVSILPAATPLVPLLADQLGCDVRVRCLSPVPTDAAPRSRAFLQNLHALLNSLDSELNS